MRSRRFWRPCAACLIKGDRKERDAFAWYEKALEQGVNLTRLYEYFPLFTAGGLRTPAA
ncbi:MAG: DUF5717 family protein [Enterocloster clostridioformis]